MRLYFNAAHLAGIGIGVGNSLTQGLLLLLLLLQLLGLCLVLLLLRQHYLFQLCYPVHGLFQLFCYSQSSRYLRASFLVIEVIVGLQWQSHARWDVASKVLQRYIQVAVHIQVHVVGT